MIAGLENECTENNKVAGKIALILAGVYSTLIMIVYFTQCTSVLNDNLSQEALKVLDYSSMGLMFNLDLLGYAIMALSTFFIGLTLNVNNKKDKALKYNILVVPSNSFGINGYFRISYCVDYDTIVNSIKNFELLYNECIK